MNNSKPCSSAKARIFVWWSTKSEGRTEHIAKIRGNRTEQAIKSIVVMIRFGKNEPRYALANVPGDCRVDLKAIRDLFGGTQSAFRAARKSRRVDGMRHRLDSPVFVQ